MKKIIVILTLLVIICNKTIATSYIYTEEKIEEESSISTMTKNPKFEFQSVSQILIEVSTGNVIYASNENQKILPASVTKVMTMLLTMEAIDSGKLNYDDIIVCSANASRMGGSQIWFKEGETLTVSDALKAIAVVSANDVTLAMAEHIGGSESNFVNMMNEKAKELGMENTNFENCHGIDSDNHYTTAKDISIMSRELIAKHPDILKYTSIWMDTLRNGTFNLSSTNKLIRFYDGANGLKTGYTTNARYNLAASATRGNITFLAVVCCAPTAEIRNDEAKQLLDFGFNNFDLEIISDKISPIETTVIEKSIGSTVNVYSDNINVLKEKGTKLEYDVNIEYFGAKAPLSANDIVGRITYTEKNNSENIIATSNLIVNEDVEKSKFTDYLVYIMKKISV